MHPLKLSHTHPVMVCLACGYTSVTLALIFLGVYILVEVLIGFSQAAPFLCRLTGVIDAAVVSTLTYLMPLLIS